MTKRVSNPDPEFARPKAPQGPPPRQQLRGSVSVPKQAVLDALAEFQRSQKVNPEYDLIDHLQNALAQVWPAPADKLVGGEPHSDDLAVDRFAAAMKAKLAEKRLIGAEPKRWLIEETVASGAIRWQVVEHEHHAKKIATATGGTVTPLYAQPAPAEQLMVDDFTHRLIENTFSWAMEGCHYLDPKSMERLIEATESGMKPEEAATWRSDLPEIMAKRARLLREHWASFCDADPFPGSDVFADRMEAAGFIELVQVTKEALEDAFAAERGIEKGGMMYRLTDAGRAALATATEGSGE